MCIIQMPPKCAKTTGKKFGGSISFDSSRFITSTAQEVFDSQFLSCSVLYKREVKLSKLPPHVASIFTSRSWEPIFYQLTSPSKLLSREFFANIHK